MTINLTTFLIGMLTILFSTCLYSTILYDKKKAVTDFLLLEIFKIQTARGNVLVINKEDGGVLFCSLSEYEKNKDTFELSELSQLFEIKDEKSE